MCIGLLTFALDYTTLHRIMTEPITPRPAIDESAPPDWPDELQAPEPIRVQALLTSFWLELRQLSELIQRTEHLLAEASTAHLRALVLEMMLALNGIQPPQGTRHLNGYLSDSQRAAIQKTLIAPEVSAESWIGRAVALVVIYRWYAPQLVEKFGLDYPQKVEEEVWSLLRRELPDWPATITSDE